MQSNRKHFLAIIRHGERADFAGIDPESVNFDNKDDPPLTPHGQNLAAKTGTALAPQLGLIGDNFDEIIIESSPFVRCIQTASQISSKLGINKLTINWTASEV